MMKNDKMLQMKNLFLSIAVCLLMMLTGCSFNVNVNNQPGIKPLQGDGKQFQTFPASMNDANHVQRLNIMKLLGIIGDKDDGDYRYNQWIMVNNGVHNDSVVLFRDNVVVFIGSSKKDSTMYWDNVFKYLDLSGKEVYNIISKRDSNTMDERTMLTMYEDDKPKMCIERFVHSFGLSDTYDRDSACFIYKNMLDGSEISLAINNMNEGFLAKKAADGTMNVEKYLPSECDIKEKLGEVASNLKDSTKGAEFEFVLQVFDAKIPKRR